jgi:hypothetical protein
MDLDLIVCCVLVQRAKKDMMSNGDPKTSDKQASSADRRDSIHPRMI